MHRVPKPHATLHDLAQAFHEDAVRAIDHDVVDGLVLEQWLERTQPDHVMHQIGREFLLLAPVQLHAPLGRQV